MRATRWLKVSREERGQTSKEKFKRTVLGARKISSQGKHRDTIRTYRFDRAKGKGIWGVISKAEKYRDTGGAITRKLSGCDEYGLAIGRYNFRPRAGGGSTAAKMQWLEARTKK